jgi:hypothetical protein
MRLAQLAEHEAKPGPGDEPRKGVLDGPYSAAILLLAGYCLEMQLKTAFILHGGTPAYLKLLGHDLERALKECRRLRFEPRFSDIDTVLDTLNQGHSRHHFRYESPDAAVLPPPGLMFQAIRSLGLQIAPMIEGEQPVRFRLPYFDGAVAGSRAPA